MKNSALLVLLGLLLLASPVFAEDSTSSHSAMHPLMNNVRKNMQQLVETKREEAKAAFQTKRMELKTKLQEIKDTHKQAVAQTIDTRLVTINKNRTDEMTRALTRLQDYLDRLKTLAQTAQSEGKDTTLLQTAMTTVQTDIDTAQDAITTQAGKEYVADISTDETLGPAFSKIVTQLKTDLLATHKTLETARADLLKAVREWEKIKKIGTPSASSSAETNL